MPGFESCCLTSRREIQKRLISLIGLAIVALLATHMVGERSRSVQDASNSDSTVEVDSKDDPILPEPMLPESEVVQAQRSAFQDFEAKP